jgi:hypothetical protein
VCLQRAYDHAKSEVRVQSDYLLATRILGGWSSPSCTRDPFLWRVEINRTSRSHMGAILAKRGTSKPVAC